MTTLEIFIINGLDIHLSPIYLFFGNYNYDSISDVTITNNTGSHIPDGFTINHHGSIGLNEDIHMGFTMPEPLENGESTVVQLLLKGNITHAVPTTEFQLTIDWP